MNNLRNDWKLWALIIALLAMHSDAQQSVQAAESQSISGENGDTFMQEEAPAPKPKPKLPTARANILNSDGTRNTDYLKPQLTIPDNRNTGMFLEEVDPSGHPIKRKPMVDLSNVNVQVDPSGSTVPLIDHSGLPVRPLYSNTQAFQEMPVPLINQTADNPLAQPYTLDGQPAPIGTAFIPVTPGSVPFLRPSFNPYNGSTSFNPYSTAGYGYRPNYGGIYPGGYSGYPGYGAGYRGYGGYPGGPGYGGLGYGGYGGGYPGYGGYGGRGINFNIGKTNIGIGGGWGYPGYGFGGPGFRFPGYGVGYPGYGGLGYGGFGFGNPGFGYGYGSGSGLGLLSGLGSGSVFGPGFGGGLFATSGLGYNNPYYSPDWRQNPATWGNSSNINTSRSSLAVPVPIEHDYDNSYRQSSLVTPVLRDPKTSTGDLLEDAKRSGLWSNSRGRSRQNEGPLGGLSGSNNQEDTGITEGSGIR